MANDIFPLFHAAFPPSRERVVYDPSRHKDFAGKVPVPIATEWQDMGFGAYGGGLIWTVVPDEPILNPEDWSALDGTGIEILRTAFGSVCLWQSGQLLWLNIHTGKAVSFDPNPEILFDSVLIEKNFRRKVLLEPLFNRSRRRLGDLNPDECFGFAPLPALGGAIADEYVIKTRMREYAVIASQVIS